MQVIKEIQGLYGSLTYIACGVRRSAAFHARSHGDGSADDDADGEGTGCRALRNRCWMSGRIVGAQCVPQSACRQHAGGDHRGRCSCAVQPDVGVAGQLNTLPETRGSNLTGRYRKYMCNGTISTLSICF